MKIPEKLRLFNHPTLVIIGDFNETVVYQAQGEDIEVAARIKAPEPPILPPEGSVTSGGGRFMNPSADLDQGEDRARYTKQIMEQIEPMLDETKYINLVLPSEMCRRFKEKLPQKNKSMITKWIEADLAHEPLLDIIKRLSQVVIN